MSSLPKLQDLLETVRVWARGNVAATGVDEAEQIALAVGRAVSETVVEEAIGALEEQRSYAGRSVACDCGYRAAPPRGATSHPPDVALHQPRQHRAHRMYGSVAQQRQMGQMPTPRSARDT